LWQEAVLSARMLEHQEVQAAEATADQLQEEMEAEAVVDVPSSNVQSRTWSLLQVAVAVLLKAPAMVHEEDRVVAQAAKIFLESPVL
jgi:Ca2+/H+ antiporter